MVIGHRLSVTIQLRNTLCMLLRHGEVHDGSDPPAPDFELWQGIWTPKTKSWLQMAESSGCDTQFAARLDELLDGGQMASDIGVIPRDGGDYLKFLIEAKRAAATLDDGPLLNKLWQLRHDELYASYVEHHGGVESLAHKLENTRAEDRLWLQNQSLPLEHKTEDEGVPQICAAAQSLSAPTQQRDLEAAEIHDQGSPELKVLGGFAAIIVIAVLWMLFQ